MSSLAIVILFAALCIIMMVLEFQGLGTTLTLAFKSDVKRETRFIAQYGQLVCTFFTALLVWQLDRARGLQVDKALWTAVIGATAISTVLKRLLGRARPHCPDAGKFLGPSWKGGNNRESFPSSHSASAVAFSCVLATAYPSAAVTFWALALMCAGLRYVLDAHWPSDVLGGIAVGGLGAMISWRIFF